MSRVRVGGRPGDWQPIARAVARGFPSERVASLLAAGVSEQRGGAA